MQNIARINVPITVDKAIIQNAGSVRKKRYTIVKRKLNNYHITNNFKVFFTYFGLK